MKNEIELVWEDYALSWKATTADEKRALFAKCLDTDCIYTSPVITTHGWNDLVTHMLEFHKNVPGGYFNTTYFRNYDNKSIARWDMITGDDVVVGDGISYCEYNNNGKLLSMTGFFDVAG
ncbi:MAG: nuclear transport factor 2 family protein [Thiohalomonadales bacterium]